MKNSDNQNQFNQGNWNRTHSLEEIKGMIYNEDERIKKNLMKGVCYPVLIGFVVLYLYRFAQLFFHI